MMLNIRKFYMKKIFFIFYIVGLLNGCASHTFGYSDEEWASLTSEQREEVIAEVDAKINENKEATHNKELTNKNINVIHRSRSNVYTTWPGNSPSSTLFKQGLECLNWVVIKQNIKWKNI